jgi:glycine/D-amino acid oxidase-like deaminating enzyme
LRTCVIIGAGFAGAATAYHLTRLGGERVMVLEQEPMAGVHALGRNAAMVRQVVFDELTAAPAREGTAFLRQLRADWPVETGFSNCGSFLLGRRFYGASTPTGSSAGTAIGNIRRITLLKTRRGY